MVGARRTRSTTSRAVGVEHVVDGAGTQPVPHRRSRQRDEQRADGGHAVDPDDRVADEQPVSHRGGREGLVDERIVDKRIVDKRIVDKRIVDKRIVDGRSREGPCIDEHRGTHQRGNQSGR